MKELIMNSILKSVILSIAILAGSSTYARNESYDVFVPITKYLAQGNAEALSAWFSENLDISVLSPERNCSRNQAELILETFFNAHTPRSFEITHTAGRANKKYALGNLNAGGETFLVTIFVSSKGGTFSIQQLKIERRD